MRKYNATAYLNKQNYLNGYLTIDGSHLEFHSNEIVIRMNSNQISISTKGERNQLICIEDVTTKYQFTLEDHSILNESTFSNFKRDVIRNKSRKGARKATFIILGIFSLITISLIGAFFFYKSKIINTLADKIPAHIEKELGQSYIDEITKKDGLDSNSQVLTQLVEKTRSIFIQSTIPFKMYISYDTTINAFALPGGFIVFNKGLLLNAKSWEEVLGVASHEMAHVTMKHHGRGLISQVGWVALFGLLFGDGGTISQLVLGTAGQLEQLSYSRDFENEADSKGFEYLLKANVNPQGMVDFFKTLDKIHSTGSSIPEFASTHPDTKNRIETIQKLVNAQSGKSYTDLGDYSEFKNFVKTNLGITTKLNQ